MKFASQQIWNIILPTQIIKVKISELDELYVGSGLDKDPSDWETDDYKVSPKEFKNFGRSESNLLLMGYQTSQIQRSYWIFSPKIITIYKTSLMQLPVQEIPSSASFPMPSTYLTKSTHEAFT